MQKMQILKNIIQLITARPGLTPVEIAEHLKIPQPRVTSSLATHMAKPNPVFRRERFKPLGRMTTYRYYMLTQPAPRITSEAVEAPPPNVQEEEQQVADSIRVQIKRLAEAIASEVASRMLAELEVAISEKLKTLTLPQIAAAVSGKQAAPLNKLKVHVVGAYNGQIATLKQEFGEMRLSFSNADENLHQLKDKARNADHVCIMTKFISHKHVEVVQSAKPRNVHLVDGAVSNLRDKLTEIYVNEPSAA
ncbi:MAG: hypothetical protein LBV29_03160 [Azoarcus sp.]|jgi:hypothetical protein|nr:hypothetical protein [Azoarcus sp.]